jgi:hypothetical protein
VTESPFPAASGVAENTPLKALHLDLWPCTEIYQIRHAFALTIGWPALQRNACSNSGMLETTPLTLCLSVECESPEAAIFNTSGVILPQ